MHLVVPGDPGGPLGREQGGDRGVLAVGGGAVGGVGLALGAVGRMAPEAEGEVGFVARGLPGQATVVSGERGIGHHLEREGGNPMR